MTITSDGAPAHSRGRRNRSVSVAVAVFGACVLAGLAVVWPLRWLLLGDGQAGFVYVASWLLVPGLAGVAVGVGTVTWLKRVMYASLASAGSAVGIGLNMEWTDLGAVVVLLALTGAAVLASCLGGLLGVAMRYALRPSPRSAKVSTRATPNIVANSKRTSTT